MATGQSATNYFISKSNQGDLRTLNTQKYYYGTTPKQAIVEQNQTYFAYFDGVGGTGPEYIDGTSYFIKYLIDTEGNVVNPEPFTVVDSPQAVGLYNLVDNFEVGKNAIVKLIEPDPTIDEIPNAEILQGAHRIAHVGRIVPILVSETGENKQDYITTMSFGSPTSPIGPPTNPDLPEIVTIGSVTARFEPSYNFEWFDDEAWNSWGFDSTIYNSNNTWTNNSTYFTINSSSLDTNARIRFWIVVKAFVSEEMDNDNSLYVRVVKNGSTVIYEDGVVVWRPANSVTYTYEFLTDWFNDYADGDEFAIEWRNGTGGEGFRYSVYGNYDGTFPDNTSFVVIEQDPSAGTTEVSPNSTSASTPSTLIGGVNAVYFPFFRQVYNRLNSVINDPVIGPSTEEIQALFNTSYLTLSTEASLLYDSGLIQNLDPASALMGFSEIKIPFSDVKRGDFIRFEYDKTQIYTIVNIVNTFQPNNQSPQTYRAIQVTPNIGMGFIGNTTLELNHFVIYRVINDGVYVTLDVRKDAPGGAYSGILQPEFVSQELVDKYDKIIQTLTEKELIQ